MIAKLAFRAATVVSALVLARAFVLVVSAAAPASPQEAPAPTQAGAVPRDPVVEAAARLVRDGKPDEALLLVRKAAEAHPEWPSPLLILARMHFASGQSDRGRATLEEAAAENPDDPSVALTFAAIDLAEGRRHDAKLNADLALEMAPKIKDAAQGPAIVRDARKILATVAETRQDWPSARDQLLAVLGIEPKDGATRQNLARVLFRMGKNDDALRELTTASKDVPALEPPDVAMAMLYARSGDPKGATEWFDRALKAQPKSARPRISYALWQVDQGRPQVAKSLADEAAAVEPESKEARKVRGLVAFHLRDLATTETIYEALHREAPDEVGITNLLALSLVDQQDKAKRARGLQLAEALARQYPRSAEILATLGHAHDRNGHPQDAEINLRAAVSGGRAAPDTAYFLARVLADRGRADEARKLLVAATSQRSAFAYRKEATDLLNSLPAATPTPSR